MRRYLGEETKYQVSTILKDGLRRATVDTNHYGYVNNKGKLIINIQYEKAFDFHEKRARVELNGKIGFINKKNKRVIPIEYDSGSIQAKDGLIRLYKNGKGGFLSKNNKQIIGFYYDRTKNFNQGLAGVCNDNEWGYIDLNNNKIIPLTFEDCRSFNEGIAGVKLNGKWGFVCIPSKQSIFSIILKILLSPKTNNRVIDEFGNNLYDRIELIKPAPKQTKRQKEFIEAVDSLKSLTSEIEEYLENNKQDESVYDWQRKIRINVNEDACIRFLQKYGKGELTESMRRFANGEGETIKDKYRNWLKWSKANKKPFSTKDNSTDNVVSNTENIMPEYNWEGIEGGWYEIFIYLYDIEHSTKGYV